MSEVLFGGKTKQVDKPVVSAEPGINSGFQAIKLFEYVKDVGKDGRPFEAVRFSFGGPLTVNQQVFRPSRQVDPSKDPKELEKKFVESCQRTNEILMMYIGTYYGADKVFDLPAITTYDEFVEKFEVYVDKIRSYVPDNVSVLSHDLLLGRQAGESYLNLPQSTRITGRYVKLTDDATRSLVESATFQGKFKAAVTTPSSATAPSAANVAAASQALAATDWTKPAA